jgi:hypothetical protein
VDREPPINYISITNIFMVDTGDYASKYLCVAIILVSICLICSNLFSKSGHPGEHLYDETISVVGDTTVQVNVLLCV